MSTVNKVNKESTEIKEEMSKGKSLEVMRRGSFAAKSEVRASWEPGESGAAAFVEVRSDVNVEAKVEVFGMKEVKNLKDGNKVERLDAKKALILVNIDKVGMQSFMKEVCSSGGAIEKALMIVMFLMKERFVNRFRPDCPVELSDYG